MIRILASEFILDIKETFKGWKLVILLVVIGLAIIMSKMGAEDALDPPILFFIVWTCTSMRPIIGKLYYILPMEEKSKYTYVFWKSLGILLFNIIFYLMMICIPVVLSNCKYMDEVRQMIYEVVPLMIIYISLGMISGYNTNLPNKNNWIRKHLVIYILSMLTTIIPMYLLVFEDYINGGWYLVFTISSYMSAFLILGCHIAACKNMDISYENIRKVEKLFS